MVPKNLLKLAEFRIGQTSCVRENDFVTFENFELSIILNLQSESAEYYCR